MENQDNEQMERVESRIITLRNQQKNRWWKISIGSNQSNKITREKQ